MPCMQVLCSQTIEPACMHKLQHVCTNFIKKVLFLFEDELVLRLKFARFREMHYMVTYTIVIQIASDLKINQFYIIAKLNINHDCQRIEIILIIK